jgi:hypothetical protein
MGLKGNWKDKVNGQDFVNAEDINQIAKSVIDIEDEVANMATVEDIENAIGKALEEEY